MHNQQCGSFGFSPELALVELTDVSSTEAFLPLVIPMQPPILGGSKKQTFHCNILTLGMPLCSIFAAFVLASISALRLELHCRHRRVIRRPSVNSHKPRHYHSLSPIIRRYGFRYTIYHSLLYTLILNWLYQSKCPLPTDHSPQWHSTHRGPRWGGDMQRISVSHLQAVGEVRYHE